jgi:pilus assembly protein CpaC
MMLAGLIKNVSLQKMENTPGLRSLPVLGALFSSQEFERKQSELVVIVTPYIVSPTEEKKLATPIDRFNNATDLQQFFLGRMNRVYGLPGSEDGAGTYNGQVGHIIE